MTAPANVNTDIAKKPGRQKEVWNREVVQTRFDIFANSVTEVLTGKDMIATAKIAIANLPSDKQDKIVSMLGSGISAANQLAWKQFGALMSRMITKLSRQADDSVIGELQYDAMEKLLPIILELYGDSEDEVENDE